ncbi:MAG: SWIM zinc finger family protein [Candidatus Uhrbacteria bacterium]
MSVKFSSDLAFRLANHASFHKGEVYFEDGAVNKVWLEGRMYKAFVTGTRQYNVSISVKTEDDVQAECDCPYEGSGICKHVVATILALANNPELAVVNVQNKLEKQEQMAKKMLAQANKNQIKNFLKQLLLDNEQIIHDFNIFLQGSKQTKATTQSYKAKIMKQLDKLDLDEMENAWLNSGEDSYDYYGYRDDNGYGEQTLSSIIDPFKQEAQKYANNKNFTESGKIFQAAIEALRDKAEEASISHLDVEDWFLNEIIEILNLYCQVLTVTNEAGIKQVGLEYFCLLFTHKQFEWYQKQLELNLTQAVITKSEADICLRALVKIQTKSNLSSAESSLLALLYLLVDNENRFEKISLDNLGNNPALSLKLLKFYKQRDRKSDILKITDSVLTRLNKKDNLASWNFSNNVEIEIREFLKTIFDPEKEYPQVISNLETLFLKSEKLNDYKNLAKVYNNPLEKENFLVKMKDIFTKQHEIEILFKVFKMEDKKQEILELTGKYKDENSFPDMISFVSAVYPQESFLNYQSKIKHLLKDANVKYYPQVVYHLKQMKRIGLTVDFKNFVVWITDFYKRRYRLMEELQKGGFI